ncbi:MAG TPA: hypothetical protein VE573_00200 [Nitrososphaeraceae archaeon]|jgi:hypothetical protein|nr:hypothetical protein [Thermoproteota archaeon]HZA61265.1 hypothetical protein [Nitrososphaeraceae archaeon]
MKFDWIGDKRFGKKDSDSAYQLAQLETVMGIAIQENNVRYISPNFVVW